MTDAELRDAAVAELQQTTRGLKGFTPPPKSHWGKAMSALEQIGQVAPPPPPGEGVLWSKFTDFYNRIWGYNDHPNGQIFVNRWRPPMQGYQTLAAPQDPWASVGGPSITEVSTAKGPGFRLRCTPEMLSSAGVKRVELADVNSGGSPHGPTKMFRGNGFTDELRFWLRYPSSGNPNGIPGNTNRWNLFFQAFDLSQNAINLGAGINMDNGARRIFFGAMTRQGSVAAASVDLPFQMQFDVDYRVRMQMRWSTSSGFMKVWVDDVLYLDFTGATLFSLSGALLGCLTYYGPSQLNNEVVFSDIRTVR